MTQTACVENEFGLELMYTEKGSNWDLFFDKKGGIWAEPNEKGKVAGVKSSFFGTKRHIAKLLFDHHLELDKIQFTERGLELMSGIYSHLVYDEHNKFKFAFISFDYQPYIE